MTLSPAREDVGTRQANVEELKELPKDRTFSIWGALNEFTYPGNRPSKTTSKAYDEFALKTAGAWQKRFLGVLPTTIVAFPKAINWMQKAEANNKLETAWPDSLIALSGDRCILSNVHTIAEHESARALFLKAIGPSSVLSIKPLVESHMEKYTKILEGYAASGEQFQMVPIVRQFALDVIIACSLGDVPPDELEVIRSGYGKMVPAVLSFPKALPWPLSRTPLAKVRLFNYGYAMEQRAIISKVISDIIDRRRQELSSGAKIESKYVVDMSLEKQAEQWANGGPEEGESVIDNKFIVDNVMAFLFAGQGTSVTVISRLVHILTVPELKDDAGKILEEVFTKELKMASEASGGLFSNFPLVQSVTHESVRLFPPSPGVFRRPLEDLEFNGYKIAKGSPLFWTALESSMSEKLYPDPERICPFRFVNHRRPAPSIADSAGATRSPKEPGQPRPPMFGIGRHFCPARELSKLEVIVFLKSVFGAFDLHLVEGQDLRGNFVENIPRSGLQLTVSKKHLIASG